MAAVPTVPLALLGVDLFHSYTFVYGEAVDGNDYPILVINRSDLVYITTEGEGEDAVDVYSMHGADDTDAYWYPLDKARMDAYFYKNNGMFPVIVIDNDIEYHINDATFDLDGDNGAYASYIVADHQSLTDYLNDWVAWREHEDEETGRWALIFGFGKNWNRM